MAISSFRTSMRLGETLSWGADDGRHVIVRAVMFMDGDDGGELE